MPTVRDGSVWNRFPSVYRSKFVRYGDCDGDPTLMDTPDQVQDGLAFVSGGADATIAVLASESNHPGIWQLATGTAAQPALLEWPDRQQGVVIDQAPLILETAIRISDDAEQLARFGAITVLNGVQAEFVWDAAAGRWTFVYDNGTDPAVTGNAAVGLGAADTWVLLQIHIGPTQTQFFLNGQLIGNVILDCALVDVVRWTNQVGNDANTATMDVDYYIITQDLGARYD